jgi:hypothetical protein
VEENCKGLLSRCSSVIPWNLGLHSIHIRLVDGLESDYWDDRGSSPFCDRSSRHCDDRLSDVLVVEVYSQFWTDGFELSWQICGLAEIAYSNVLRDHDADARLVYVSS